MSAGDRGAVRLRVGAGIYHVAVGGVICTVALLLMRSGVSTIPWHRGYPGLSFEFVAGIAGIVVFIGLIQLLIAFILEVRGRQGSRLASLSLDVVSAHCFR